MSEAKKSSDGLRFDWSAAAAATSFPLLLLLFGEVVTKALQSAVRSWFCDLWRSCGDGRRPHWLSTSPCTHFCCWSSWRLPARIDHSSSTPTTESGGFRCCCCCCSWYHFQFSSALSRCGGYLPALLILLLLWLLNRSATRSCRRFRSLPRPGDDRSASRTSMGRVASRGRRWSKSCCVMGWVAPDNPRRTSSGDNFRTSPGDIHSSNMVP